MNEEEAREVLRSLMIFTQRARSMIIEGVCGMEVPSKADMAILNYTNPTLFPLEGDVGLLTSIDLTARKEEVTPTELYNVLFLVHRCDPVVLSGMMYNYEIPSIEPLPSWLGGWDQRPAD